MSYNLGIMARPTKFNEDVVARFLDLISSGCSVKDAARDVRVSVMTISRWRKTHKEFNHAVLSAMMEGWDYVDDRKKEGLRTYRCGQEVYKMGNLPTKPKKLNTGASVGSQGQVSTYHRQKFIMGLPVMPRPHSLDENVPPFVNPDTWMVEQIIDGALRVCRLDVWERKHQPKEDIFIGEWW